LFSGGPPNVYSLADLKMNRLPPAAREVIGELGGYPAGDFRVRSGHDTARQ
jgi:hypothetical protein